MNLPLRHVQSFSVRTLTFRSVQNIAWRLHRKVKEFWTLPDYALFALFILNIAFLCRMKLLSAMYILIDWSIYMQSTGGWTNIKMSDDRLISMGYPVQVRWHFYIESGPWTIWWPWVITLKRDPDYVDTIQGTGLCKEQEYVMTVGDITIQGKDFAVTMCDHIMQGTGLCDDRVW